MSDTVMKAAVFCAVLLVSGPVAFAADDLEVGNTIVLESSAMKAGDAMPVDQTQHGWDLSPPLTWKNLPEGTKELALIFEGPVDAKSRPVTHWVVYSIPAKAEGLPDSLPMEDRIDDPKALSGTLQGLTEWGDSGYRGPWPGADQKYRFKLFALDADLNLKPGLDRAALMKAIKGHVIATGELVVISRRVRRSRSSSGSS